MTVLKFRLQLVFEQTVDTRRAETAFQTALDALALANETDTVFGTLRNVAVFPGEGGSRVVNALETDDQRRQRNYRHVMRERLDRTKEFFEKVARLEPLVRALFADEPADAFRRILQARNIVAVHWGMHCNWQEGAPTPNFDLMEKTDRIIWEGYGVPDEFKDKLDADVALVRQHLQEFVRARARAS